jgi:hypothetical protein
MSVQSDKSILEFLNLGTLTFSFLRILIGSGVVVHTCNLSYLGNGDQEDQLEAKR